MRSSELVVGEQYRIKDWRHTPMTLQKVLPRGRARMSYERLVNEWADDLTAVSSDTEISEIEVRTRDILLLWSTFQERRKSDFACRKMDIELVGKVHGLLKALGIRCTVKREPDQVTIKILSTVHPEGGEVAPSKEILRLIEILEAANET